MGLAEIFPCLGAGFPARDAGAAVGGYSRVIGAEPGRVPCWFGPCPAGRCWWWGWSGA